jgi:hypothetical protein
MAASQKAEHTQRTLLALLTAHAERVELDKTIHALTRFSVLPATGVTCVR